MLFQYNDRSLYYFEQGEKILLGNDVSNFIQISPEKDKILYISNSSVWNQGDIYIKADGKNPKLLGTNIRLYHVSADFNRIVFQEHYNQDSKTGQLCVYLNLKEKIIIDDGVYVNIDVFVNLDDSFKIIYNKKTSQSSNVYNLYVYDENRNNKLISENVYGFYNILHDEVDGLKIVYFVRNEDRMLFSGQMCIYDNEKVSIAIENITTRYRIVNSTEYSLFRSGDLDDFSLIVDYVRDDTLHIGTATSFRLVSIGSINIYKDFKLVASIANAYENFYYDESYSSLFFYSAYESSTQKFTLFKKDLLSLEKDSIEILKGVDPANLSIREYLESPKLDDTIYSNLDNLYTLFYFKKECKKFYIANKLAEEALEHIIIPNEDPLDESENHKVTFSGSQLDTLALMVYVLSGFANSRNDNDLLGINIYGLDVYDIIKVCSNIKGLSPSNLTVNEVSYQLAVEEARDRLINYYELKYKYQLKQILLEKVKQSHDSNNLCQKVFAAKLNTIPGEYKNRYRYYRDLASQVEEKLILENKLPAKWKSEQELYKLIKDILPTARIHYSPNWLSPQHLDICVPEIDLAFEYQGLQHFTPIKVFGGEDNFQKRIELDLRKKRLCADNGIHFLEWHYNEPITKIILIRKLNDLGIEV